MRACLLLVALLRPSPACRLSAPPDAYSHVIHELRTAIRSPSKWPPLSAGRQRVVKGCDAARGSSMVLVRPPALHSPVDGRKGRRPRVPPSNAAFPALACALFELEAQIQSRAMLARGCLLPRATGGSSCCCVNLNVEYTPHVNAGGAAPRTASMLVTLGSFSGGELVVEGEAYDVRYHPLAYDGWRQLHWTAPFEGERISLVWYTPRTDSVEQRAAAIVGALRPPVRLQYRERTTDANVVAEVLGEPSVYAGPRPHDPRWRDVSFAPRGHVVLDVGAHIGAFTVYALAHGAVRVDAFEPEPSNAQMFLRNLEGAIAEGTVELHQAAIAAHTEPTAPLLLAPMRSDGVANTWRHALEGLSHYSESSIDGTAASTRRVSVAVRPLFGDTGAITEKTTFVKMDCEGAELALFGQMSVGCWRNVRRLVFEWSFTKERSMKAFSRVVEHLESDGFVVMYEGKHNWEAMDKWPWHMDALIFAARLDPQHQTL